jgi:hypothetical protein
VIFSWRLVKLCTLLLCRCLAFFLRFYYPFSVGFSSIALSLWHKKHNHRDQKHVSGAQLSTATISKGLTELFSQNDIVLVQFHRVQNEFKATRTIQKKKLQLFSPKGLIGVRYFWQGQSLFSALVTSQKFWMNFYKLHWQTWDEMQLVFNLCLKSFKWTKRCPPSLLPWTNSLLLFFALVGSIPSSYLSPWLIFSRTSKFLIALENVRSANLKFYGGLVLYYPYSGGNPRKVCNKWSKLFLLSSPKISQNA